ncbi:hypothetical protein E9232_006347 [Inquilinus ginsengisoli]|uniref:Uncharacterized protein n=1 Tax=Inquilinus ginsengisoli TaxID=363840 RepID=A0ABU1K1Y4_9PROT|nr:hypothetical protein [Inquilinus ginsengisoli]MDR6293794.1 hypothetical protein [Inquilinus ginsengisoli]
MSFTIAATNSAGAIALELATASDAVNKFQEFQQQGYQRIVVRDNLGRALSLDELLLLMSSDGDD